ncbi:MAG: HAD family hydrolase, partial [Anaerotardibacter sp.]
ECVYVGDSPYDMQAALAAGMPGFAVDWGKFFSHEILEKENTFALVSSHEELRQELSKVIPMISA